MFETYKSGFYVENTQSLNSFAAKVVRLADEYVRFLLNRGKLIPLGDLDSYDIAVDLTAELFTIKDGHLVHFKRFFEGVENPPQTEEDFLTLLHKFIYSSLWNRLTNIIKITDPITNKLHRNLNAAFKEHDFHITDLFTNRYIHRKPVDFNSGRCMDTDLILTFLRSNNGKKHDSPREFLNFIFDAIESQTEYLHAIPYTEILKVYKEHHAFYYNFGIEKNTNSPEAGVYLKLLLEEIDKSFKVKLNKYINKKNFSQKERKCIYYIVEDVINCYIKGIDRDSVNKLAEKYYEGEVTNTLCYKIDYVIDLLNSEIISLIQREETAYARRLSEKNN